MKEETKKRIKAQAKSKATQEAIENLKERRERMERFFEEIETSGEDYKKPESLLRRLTPKSKAEIFCTGTARETAYLLAVATIALMEKKEFSISESERDILEQRLSFEERKEANALFCAIVALKAYEKSFTRSTLTMEKDAAYLAKTIQEWRGAEKLADTLTDLHRRGILSAQGKENLEALANGIELEEGSSLYFDTESDSFRVNVGTEDGSGLLRYVRMRRAFLEDSMRILRNKEEAIMEFLKERKLPEAAIPYLVQVCSCDLEGEDFLRGLLPQEHFCSSFYVDIASGREPLDEEYEKAVFPFYQTIKPSKESVAYYKREIHEEELNIFYYTRPFNRF